ncbi:AT-rich interactive domain containing protein 3 [Dissostichus eleginoides]|uniref:AT-rich interactive domain containing protein 3 n=1 Tax=Dissostichus eleginoides TaxID=100907 RepID=A0AAD9C6T7_DISEL|nr:AT-rich interactive domain containing protein 3 [Dissostichus eleginoides]
MALSLVSQAAWRGCIDNTPACSIHPPGRSAAPARRVPGRSFGSTAAARGRDLNAIEGRVRGRGDLRGRGE